MKPVAHIKPSPTVPGHGAQPRLPKLGFTDRPTPLLLEEKGMGDEVDATKERLRDVCLSVSVSIEEKGLGDEVDATKKHYNVWS